MLLCGSGHSTEEAWPTLAQLIVDLCEVLHSGYRTESSVGTDPPPASYLSSLPHPQLKSRNNILPDTKKCGSPEHELLPAPILLLSSAIGYQYPTPQLHLNDKRTGGPRMKTEAWCKTHHRSKIKGLPLSLWCPVSICPPWGKSNLVFINPVSKSAVPC